MPACELFFVALENVWIRAPERRGKKEKEKRKKKKKKKPGCGYSASTRKGGKTQTRPGSGHQEKSGRCRAPGGRLVHAFLQAPCCSRPAGRGVPSSGAGFFSYLGGLLDSTGTGQKGRRRGKKGRKIKTKMPGAAWGKPAKRRVWVPSDAVSSCPPSSPVCRCERREQRERCEDARRWNNEFIAACHPAMAISTIRHCKLPLKGRASPNTPTLPGPRLIRWGRAGLGWGGGVDRGKGDRGGGRDPARWKEGGGREQGRRGRKKYLRKQNRFPWPHLKPQRLGVCLIFHNQWGWLTSAYLISRRGVFGVLFKLLRRFKSLPASFSPAFLSLGRKFLPQVFSPLSLQAGARRPRRPCSSASTSQGLSASRAPPRPALPVPISSLHIPQTLRCRFRMPARLGFRVTNFSQPPAEGPGSWRAAEVSPGRAAGGLGTPRLCVRAARSPLSPARVSSAPAICHSIPDDWNFFALPG